MTTKEQLARRRSEHHPLKIIEECKKLNRPVFVAGPMVRYSKLPFREVVRDYGCDIVYSPMILAREFVRNGVARYSDFTTNDRDRSLIVQIGVNNTVDLLRMCEMIQPYVDGIGLNCGCPIKEQVREGIGALLMSDPYKVAELVRLVKDKFGDSLCIETKIRIHPDLDETVKFVKIVELSGVDFMTVHGRTKTTRSSVPLNFDAIKLVKSTVSCPVIANGDCFSLEDAHRIAEYTNCDGVMSVRGILANPTLFSGTKHATWGSVEKLINYSLEYGLPFRLIQHHLSCMLEPQIPKNLYLQLMDTKSTIELLDWLDQNFVLNRPSDQDYGNGSEIIYRTPN